LHLVGILFPHINDDARSKSHKIYKATLLKFKYCFCRDKERKGIVQNCYAVRTFSSLFSSYSVVSVFKGSMLFVFYRKVNRNFKALDFAMMHFMVRVIIFYFKTSFKK
jgi:hypothetical protein